MQLHLVGYTGARFPKFASFRGATSANFGNKTGTSKRDDSSAAYRFEVPARFPGRHWGTSNRRH